MMKHCKVHGMTRFRTTGSRARCAACHNKCIRDHQRRMKDTLIAEWGGKCQRCGYDRCRAALHFHHRDPSTKLFKIGSGNKGIEKQREEAMKCDLLCANCHAEEHYSRTDADTQRPGA